ncbi:MAG TPA: hypothetical protein VFA15_01430, partial [Nitrososphaera sp.]|nr:hypothetical protein [Nitrososphaera sp.]
IWMNYCVKDKKYEQDKGAEKLPAELLREKEFFTKNNEGLNKEEANLLIESNFGRRAAYHQMILSSGDRDVEPQVYARLQMDALERRLGHKLTWVANVHRDTGPDKVHINITIAGSIPDQQKIKRELPYKGKDIDHERLPAEDKFLSSDGQWYTKYHPQQELKSHSRWLKRDDDRQIDETTYKKKLWRWIGAKEHQGDDCYGTPPLKDLEKEQELGGYRPRRCPFGRLTLLPTLTNCKV